MMESLVPKIQNHLADVAQNPGVQLNQSLLESLDRHLSGKLYISLRFIMSCLADFLWNNMLI